MIAYYLLSFACGLLTKLTDNLLDEQFKPKHAALPFISALAYGSIAGFIATRATEFAAIIVAVAVGVLAAGKIDSREHWAALAALLFFVAIYGLPSINLLLLAFFAVLCFLDERLADLNAKFTRKNLWENDLSPKGQALDEHQRQWKTQLRLSLLQSKSLGKKKLRFAGIHCPERGRVLHCGVVKAANARPLLEFGALAVGIVSGNLAYFLAVFSFDAGYVLAGRLMRFSQKKLH